MRTSIPCMGAILSYWLRWCGPLFPTGFHFSFLKAANGPITVEYLCQDQIKQSVSTQPTVTNQDSNIIQKNHRKKNGDGGEQEAPPRRQSSQHKNETQENCVHTSSWAWFLVFSSWSSSKHWVGYQEEAPARTSSSSAMTSTSTSTISPRNNRLDSLMTLMMKIGNITKPFWQRWRIIKILTILTRTTMILGNITLNGIKQWVQYDTVQYSMVHISCALDVCRLFYLFLFWFIHSFTQLYSYNVCV